MIKLPDWQIHLHNYLRDNRDRDFKWGDWDCCVFADGAIHSISGVHVIPEELKWTNESDAMESIQKYGRTFANAIKKAARASGLEPIDNAQITAGDLCVYMNDNEEVCGICDGYALVSPAEQGYAFNRCDTVRIAWRVPNG
tara:strand:- start:565 stop:987 length:423 start_codon:yes stop_codon:yes gene_type:complete